MESESHTTTSHATIKNWATARGGKPATVKNTANEGEVGVLRIEFPEHTSSSTEANLDEVAWTNFFAKFDEKNLVFLYQNHTASGEISRFCRFVTHETAEHKAHHAAAKHAAENSTTSSKS
jgi:hypothetical protein